MWDLIYEWIHISEREKARMGHPCAPIKTPTMLGAFFVIMKENFLRVGMYDEVNLRIFDILKNLGLFLVFQKFNFLTNFF